MRLLIAALLFATPASAWDFSPVPVCTVTHAAPDGAVRMTHDPRLPQPYAITVTATLPWPAAPVFAMRFDGRRGLTISSTRQVLSDNGRSLTVTDSGFGNVLDGLQYNTTATVQSGDLALAFPLDGAAPAIAAFRACIGAPAV